MCGSDGREREGGEGRRKARVRGGLPEKAGVQDELLSGCVGRLALGWGLGGCLGQRSHLESL